MSRIYIFVLLFFLPNILLTQSYQLNINLKNGSKVLLPIEDISKITFEGITNIEDFSKIKNVIKTFELYQNHPNPFNPTTTIDYQIPRSGYVEIKIYNINGQLVRKLYSGNKSAGIHQIQWDGYNDNTQNVSSGLYIYQVRYENQVFAKRMVFVK